MHRESQSVIWIAAVTLLVSACRPQTPDQVEPLANEASQVARLLPGPDFELLGLDGAHHRLSDYRGKVLLVNYWATWCTSCRGEMPELDALYDDLAPSGVEVVGIATDAEGASKVRPYVEALEIGYPILLDPEPKSPSVFGGLDGYPMSFIVDAQGLLYSSYLGAQEPEVFREDLLYLTTAPPSAPADLSTLQTGEPPVEAAGRRTPRSSTRPSDPGLLR